MLGVTAERGGGSEQVTEMGGGRSLRDGGGDIEVGSPLQLERLAEAQ